ncbi:MAG: cytochrome c biogenesis CcdA family protein [Solirubrobacteraceae bacterium]
MDSSIFFGGSVVAAVISGGVALFAPCCISVMLPSYFASAFQNRRLLVAMTFLFAAGVATVILPIALGAAVLQRVLISEHTAIYTAVGVVLLALAAYTLAGGRIHLPMPGRRAGKAGPLSVYTLGVFSGAASSCCAPVLAGVIALSGLASSFGLSLGLGAAYVFGMVAPLFAISLLWDRFDWSSTPLFRPRTFTWRLGPLRRSVTGTGIASGALLALMGAGTLYIGLATDAMPAAGGWQSWVSAELQHYGSVITDALSWVPGWAGVALLLAVVGLLARRAFRELLGPEEPGEASAPGSLEAPGAEPTTQHEYVRGV